MKASTKRLLNYAFIFGTLAVVLYLGLSGNDIKDVWKALTSITPLWLGACFLIYGLYVVLDALTVYRFLGSQGYRTSFIFMLYVAIMGLYYCDVTPGASGGQPMQVYYMKKRDIPIGISSSALTVKFFCFQLMLMVIGTIAWLCFKEYVFETIGATNMWILVAGYVFNAVSVVFVLMMAVSRRLVRLFIVLFIKVGTWLRICKDPDAAMARWEGNLATFHASIMMLTRSPLELFLQLLIASAQVILWMLFPVALYFAFGLSGTTVLQLITISLMVYISAAYTPLPGGSGVQEGGFAIYFTGIFPDETLFVALLVWRFFTFYLNLISGAVLSILPSLIRKKKKQG